MTLACKRDAFLLSKEVHYLNCAYLSPLPTEVEEAGVRGVLRKREPTNILPDDFFTERNEVRQYFSKLIGVSEPNRIAIIPSASYGAAIAARNLPVKRGQNIVILHEQFPGNVYTWRKKAEEVGAELRTVIPDSTVHKGSDWNERILDSMDKDTAIISVPHVHWTDGTLFDLPAISQRAQELGTALVVDGTQSVGALPFDVTAIRPDVLIVAGYKWLLGPYSIGVAYFNSRFDEGVPLEETWIGRQGSQDFSGLVDYQELYQPGAVRYDVGECSNFILLPMLAAALNLLEQWTPHAIQAYCSDLTDKLVEEVTEFGFSAEERPHRAGHLLGLTLPKQLSLESLKKELDRRKVFVSVRGNSLRVSPNVYNNQDDIEALIEALAFTIKGR
jgi:selenocysteine lyase/cysteine desulfurase|tara:strand:+ start:307 stop:1470 length:1164 start_codon:yes stop_codon:yes gene_type:complete